MARLMPYPSSLRSPPRAEVSLASVGHWRYRSAVPEKRLAPPYADQVMAGRARGDLNEEREAMRNLAIVCRRAGAPVEALLADAVRRTASRGISTRDTTTLSARMPGNGAVRNRSQRAAVTTPRGPVEVIRQEMRGLERGLGW
jgi:hypothetical protein